MAHQIDTSNNRNNVAYVGQTPWHGLGQRLTAGAAIDVWEQEAGLGFKVLRTPVLYTDNAGNPCSMPERQVLYRDDTRAPFSVVSSRYKIVQPAEVLEFFGELAKIGGFELETAGSLAGGRRVWALARVGETQKVIGNDGVAPYVLLATSYDASMATIAKFTSVRVVCHNTLSLSASKAEGVRHIQVPHSRSFDAGKVRDSLGIVGQQWQTFMQQATALAHKEMSPEEADSLTYDLIAPTISAVPGRPAPDIRQTRGYAKIMELFSGDAVGADLTEGPSAWAWINAVTEWVDHSRGRSRDSGLESAWFGSGAVIKSRALALANEL